MIRRTSVLCVFKVRALCFSCLCFLKFPPITTNLVISWKQWLALSKTESLHVFAPLRKNDFFSINKVYRALNLNQDYIHIALEQITSLNIVCKAFYYPFALLFFCLGRMPGFNYFVTVIVSKQQADIEVEAVKEWKRRFCMTVSESI